MGVSECTTVWTVSSLWAVQLGSKLNYACESPDNCRQPTSTLNLYNFQMWSDRKYKLYIVIYIKHSKESVNIQTSCFHYLHLISTQHRDALEQSDVHGWYLLLLCVLKRDVNTAMTDLSRQFAVSSCWPVDTWMFLLYPAPEITATLQTGHSLFNW